MNNEEFSNSQQTRYSLIFLIYLKLIENLGDGAFSTVFKCKRLSDGKEYALKKVNLFEIRLT